MCHFMVGNGRIVGNWEYVVKKELETLMDNARYSDEYRQMADIDKHKDESDIGTYYSSVSSILNQWEQQYLKYKS